MQLQAKQFTSREMHKYVLVLLGVWLLFAVTAAIAGIRVSQDKKFASFHFYLQSLTLEGKLEKQNGFSADVQPVDHNSFGLALSGSSTFDSALATYPPRNK